MNLLTRTLLVLCFFASPALKAQTGSDTTANANPGSFLRIFYNPVHLAQSRSWSSGFNIEWEKPLSPRLSLSVNLYRDFSKSTPWNTDERILVGLGPNRPLYNYKDIRTSLSLNAQYYFKPNVYQGFYGALRMTNLAAEVVTYPDFSFGTSGTRKLEVNPVIGLYLGYRKTFRNGFFLDGSVGYTLDGNRARTGRISDPGHLGLKLSLGWQLNFKKKKK